MKPRVLLLTHRVPYPPDRGDRIRAWQVLQQLAAQAEVSLAALADEPVAPATHRKLSSLCEQVSIVALPRWNKPRAAVVSLFSGDSISERVFFSAKLARTIEAWRHQRAFEGVVVYCSSMYPYVAGWCDIPRLVDLIDVDSAKWMSYADEAGLAQRWLYRREARLVGQLERRIVDASTVALTTRREAELLQRSCPDAEPLVVSNGVDGQYFQCQEPALAGRIVFTGVLDYHPNVQGMLWFAEHVWPQLVRQFPELTLEIVGRNPAPAIRARQARGGISISANVPDVRPHLANAEIVVAPLQIARGIQNKVLEAMAMERPVVASAAVAAGLMATVGEHLLVADTAEQWIERVALLHSDALLRQRLSAAARRYVEQHHDWSSCLRPIIDRLTSATRVDYGNRQRIASLTVA
jgi:sugar transferase (PEP-CTERM/EpsH1 system associated)